MMDASNWIGLALMLVSLAAACWVAWDVYMRPTKIEDCESWAEAQRLVRERARYLAEEEL